MDSHYVLFKGQRVSLWKANISELKEQITSILLDLSLGEKEDTSVRIWKNDAAAYLQKAYALATVLRISLFFMQGGKKERFSSDATIHALSAESVILNLSVPLPTQTSWDDYCELSFLVMEGDSSPTEIFAKAHLLELSVHGDVALVSLSIPHRTVSRLVRQERVCSHAAEYATLRIAQVAYAPRTLSGLRAGLRLPKEYDPKDIPVLHRVTHDGLCVRLSSAQASLWARSFDPFLIFFLPHFGKHRRVSIFMGRKTKLQRSEQESLLELRLTQRLTLRKKHIHWEHIPEEGVLQLRALVQEKNNANPA